MRFDYYVIKYLFVNVRSLKNKECNSLCCRDRLNYITLFYKATLAIQQFYNRQASLRANSMCNAEDGCISQESQKSRFLRFMSATLYK